MKILKLFRASQGGSRISRASGLGILAVFFVSTTWLPAQTNATFFSDFNAGVPAGMTLLSNAVASEGFLKLTTNGGGQLGIAIVDNLPTNQDVLGFHASFKLAFFGGGPVPADGFSFSLVPAATGIPLDWGAEEGLSSGLSVSFDTYNNGGNEAPAVDIWWNGTL